MWLAVALAFRFLGQDLFSVGSSGVSWLFLIAPVLLAGATYALLRLLRVAQADRSEAASVFAATGLVVGIVEISGYSKVFPNLSVALGSQFAALMFACYAAVVFAGIVSSRLENI
jgi:hypothetical protein